MKRCHLLTLCLSPVLSAALPTALGADSRDNGAALLPEPAQQSAEAQSAGSAEVNAARQTAGAEQTPRSLEENRRLISRWEGDIDRLRERLAEFRAEAELPVIKETITEDSESHSETVITTTVPFIASKDDDIKTSRIRKNVLAEWDDPDNYVEPVGLFKFLSGGKFRKIDKHDFDEQSLLTLAVKESEIKGYMVLGYETGHIVKVSVEELLEYTNREYSRNMESKLIFASIADKNDGIITISQEDKARGKVVIRLDQLSNIEEGRLMDSGKMLFNEGLISKVLAYDVIPSRYIEEFKGILDRPRTIAGYPENSVTKRIIEKLHQWGIIEI